MNRYINSISNENTKKAFITIAQKIEEYAKRKNKDFLDFNKDDIDDLIKTQYKKASETTLANLISQLKNFYKFYGKSNIVNHLNLNYVKSIAPYRKHEFFTPEQIYNFIERLHNFQDKALVALTYIGLYDENFETIRHLKESQIHEGYIDVKGKKIEISPYIYNILMKAMMETVAYKYIDQFPKDENAKVILKENTGYLLRAKKIKNSTQDVISLVSIKKKFVAYAKFLGEENFTPITVKNSKTLYDLVKLELELNSGFDINQIELKRICKEENKKACVEQLNVSKKEIKNKIIKDILLNKDVFI